jgi:hypothetical protein
MRTDPPFVIPDAFPENKKTEPIEEKQKIRRELPEKSFSDESRKKSEEADCKKKAATPPDDPFGQKGKKFDMTA